MVNTAVATDLSDTEAVTAQAFTLFTVHLHCTALQILALFLLFLLT